MQEARERLERAGWVVPPDPVAHGADLLTSSYRFGGAVLSVSSRDSGVPTVITQRGLPYVTTRRLTTLLVAVAVAAALATLGGPAAAATAPNGLIAYSAWDANMSGYDVWLTDPAQPGAAPVRLTKDGQYNDNPDWSPDGTRIAFDGWAQHGWLADLRHGCRPGHRRLDTAHHARLYGGGWLLPGLPARRGRRTGRGSRSTPTAPPAGGGWAATRSS